MYTVEQVMWMGKYNPNSKIYETFNHATRIRVAEVENGSKIVEQIMDLYARFRDEVDFAYELYTPDERKLGMEREHVERAANLYGHAIVRLEGLLEAGVEE